MKKDRFVAVAALASLASCGIAPVTKQQFLHSLTVNENGNPERVAVPAELDMKPDFSFEDQVRRITASKKWGDKKRVLIFVHGGLNTIEDGLERTAKLVPAIEGDTGCETYPIMVNWNSELLGSYGDHLLHYHNGERKPDVWRALASPFVLLADVGRAVTRMPIVYFDQGKAAARKLIGRAEGAAVPTDGVDWSQRVRLDEREPRWSLGDNLVDGFLQVFPGFLRILTTPLVDTVGYEGYDILQRRIDTLFFTNDDLRTRTQRPSGAAYALMRRIPHETEIILVGHSMGTIVLNEWIRRFPEHNYTRIVYMAAACTIKDFMDAVPDYVTHNRNAKFYGLCIHPAADEGELSGYGSLPNGSLLEWLDAYVLGPRSSVHRTLGKWDNVVPMLPLLNDLPDFVRRAIHVKGFTVRGDDYPCSHGAFDDYCFWRESFWDPLDQEPVQTVDSLLEELAKKH